MKIFLIYGGKSAEHDISILTAYSIMKEVYYKYYEVVPVYITKEGAWLKGLTLDAPPTHLEALHLTAGEEAALAIKEGAVSTGVPITIAEIKEKDAVIFPVLHGPNGEDGTIQGLFEILDMPYVGAGVLASACGMDKIISKHLFTQAGLPQVPFIPIIKTDWLRDEEKVLAKCDEILDYPMFIKPANLGSSVGISKAMNQEELIAAIETALKYDRRVLVEQGVEAREVEVAVLGNDDVHTSVPGEIVKATNEFYDYQSKYLDNKVTMQIPALLPEEVQTQLREYAATAFKAIDGSGLTRCDFFVTDDHEIFINEVNTMPGFTEFSMYPLLWENTGLNYSDLVEELIQLAIKRFEEKQSFITER
ncbi:D-alanine--D-alanine ligase [Isobaculum melis]|uniref:D-alanine--D-alanine ligase n=1 Tax=Isobaculum melis TaxID=142588 RepID=A0A1H9U2F2_9LACT|nr:D-alanine--D-alanine ligase [Isobaculum melis]SES03421.1 D-alanine--D-alanine ligase [Isobaculum melis]